MFPKLKLRCGLQPGCTKILFLDSEKYALEMKAVGCALSLRDKSLRPLLLLLNRTFLIVVLLLGLGRLTS